MRLFAIVVALTSIVHADAPGDAAIQAGTDLAGQGRFKDAIVQFKAAHTAAPDRPEPDCLIALAYRRLERWGQARLFLMRCTQFATHPSWFDQLVTDIDQGLQHGGLTQVTFAVTPAAAQIAVSSFAPDETFAPQPIFLEPGKQLVTITAAGFKQQQLAIDIPATGAYEVKAELEPPHEALPPPPPPKPQPQPEPPPPPSQTGKYLVYASAGVVAIGVAAHIAAAIQRSNLTTSAHAFDDGIGTFHTERDVAIGAYAVGAVGLAVGAWLWHGAVTPVVEPHATGVAWGMSW
jgi:hypothetical protein